MKTCRHLLLGLCLVASGLQVGLGAQEKDLQRECSFELSYKVKVSASTTRVILTALVPQDLEGRQKVKSLDFTPKPKKIFTSGGDRYARWEIRPKGDFTIRMQAKMLLERNDLATAKARKPKRKPKPPADLDDCLLTEKFIESNAKSIREAAGKITPEVPEGSSKAHAMDQDLRLVRAIHAWVLRNMKEGGHNAKDLGAVAALRAGTGDCTEYSDLFVALCRAKGVPARVIEGYTTTWDTVPQHNWTEVWLQEHGWVSFDPFRAEWLGTSVDSLKNIYIQLSRTRNNKTLWGYHFYHYSYGGDGIQVSSDFKVLD